MTSPNSEGLVEVWIGMAECVPETSDAELFCGGSGAFINLVALVASKSAFRASVEAKLSSLGAAMIELEDVETLEERRTRWKVDEELEVAAAALVSEGDVEIATLDIYMKEEN